jgi:hypothetical protein
LNLCRPVLSTVCGAGVAGCQQWDPYTNYWGWASLGEEYTQTFTWGTQQSKFLAFCFLIFLGGESGLIVTYSRGSSPDYLERTMQIDFVCNATAETVTIIFSLFLTF